jgi:hypothetical protein
LRSSCVLEVLKLDEVIFFSVVEEDLVQFVVFEIKTASKEYLVALLTLLYFTQLLNKILGSTRAQLIPHDDIIVKRKSPNDNININ